jgi:hypothetical protein
MSDDFKDNKQGQEVENCNIYGSFVLDEYYVGNGGIPENEEIWKIIDVVRNGNHDQYNPCLDGFLFHKLHI